MKRKRFAALLAALALCVTGCARDASVPAAKTPASSGPAPSPVASPAMEAAGELTFHRSLDGAAEENSFYTLHPGTGGRIGTVPAGPRFRAECASLYRARM